MTAALGSCLYQGWVTHVRLAPPAHRFRYPVAMLLVDVDELPVLDRTLRLFGYNRPRPVGFHDADHFGGTEEVRAAAQRLVDPAGARPLGRVRILTHARTLGYVFNPVSFLWCDWADGTPAARIAEVNNTYGDRHAYVLPGTDGAAPPVEKKRLHVSPFLGLAGSYRFRMPRPDRALRIGIDFTEGGAPRLRTRLVLRRRALTDGALLGSLVRRPLNTVRVIAAIHLEAWRLWRKGARFRPRPPYDPVAAGRMSA